MIDITSLPVTPTTFEELEQLVGRMIGPTPWYDVPQQSIDAFAEVTGDHQWIHVDPERAAAGPFGSTIAHGLFSLSLGPALSEQLLSLAGFAHSLNYGYDRVRFPAPLPVGSRVRMSVTIVAVEPVAGGVQLRGEQVFEREGSTKPVAVAESLARLSNG